MKECAKTRPSSRGGTTKRSPSMETRRLLSMGLLHSHAAIPSGFAMTDGGGIYNSTGTDSLLSALRFKPSALK
jgi:hypothetical protein